jgi:hypothetical protein
MVLSTRLSFIILMSKKSQEQQDILKKIMELIHNQGIKVKKLIIARKEIPKNIKFFSSFIDMTYQLGKLNKDGLLPDNSITYQKESWYDLILFFKYHYYNPNTLHYHLLRYVAYSLKDLCKKYSPQFIYQLFFTLEEHAITGLYKIPVKSNFFKFMQDNYGDITEPHLISNTHIIAMINKLYPRLHNKRKSNKNTNKNNKKRKNNSNSNNESKKRKKRSRKSSK